MTLGEFRIRERPVVTHLERPVAVAREYETRLRTVGYHERRMVDSIKGTGNIILDSFIG